MRIKWSILGALAVIALSAAVSFAETIELVTYYPAPGGGAGQDVHAKSLTVGTAYGAVAPTDGEAIIRGSLGIGPGFDAAAPEGLLHVVGENGTPSKVLFMPGAGTGTISVGIGMANPPSLLGLGVDGGAVDTRQAITIGNAGLHHPEQQGSTSATGDKLVMWDDAATASKAAIGLDANNEMWLQSSGNNANNKITFYTSNTTANPSERMRIDSAGNVGIGTTTPGEKLDVSGNARVSGNVQVDGAMNGAKGVFIDNLFLGKSESSPSTFWNTASTTFVDIPGSDKTITLPAGIVVITYSLSGFADTPVSNYMAGMWKVQVVIG